MLTTSLFLLKEFSFRRVQFEMPMMPSSGEVRYNFSQKRELHANEKDVDGQVKFRVLRMEMASHVKRKEKRENLYLRTRMRITVDLLTREQESKRVS